MAGTKKSRRNNNRAGKFCISMIVIVFVAVMSVQIVKIYEKDQEYIEKQAELEAQLEEENERQAELEEYEDYTNTQKYVESVAKSKLGLAYDNEIIFKEKD